VIEPFSTVTEEPLCNTVLQWTLEVGPLRRDAEASDSVHNLRIEGGGFI
jgi:hypothetical protein